MARKLGDARGVCKQFFSNLEPFLGSNAACLCHVTWPEKKHAEFEITRHGLAQGRSGLALRLRGLRLSTAEAVRSGSKLPRTRAERMGLSEIWLLHRLDRFSLCTRVLDSGVAHQ